MRHYYEANRAKEAENNSRLPVRGVVNSPLPDRDLLRVEIAGVPGLPRVPIRQPYMGVNSWIRVMPEAGTEITTIRRGDLNNELIVGYESTDGERRVQQYREGNLIYRTLDPGELELMSSGRAYAFFGNLGDIELRGGVIRHNLLQSQLEINSTAPTYIKRLHKSTPSTLAHEERFGVVKRPDQKKPNIFQQYVRNDDKSFSVEHSRWLNKSDGTLITRKQEGNVVDKGGKFEKQSSTQKPLRYVHQVMHANSGDFVYQVDEELNVLIKNSSTAKETKIDLGTTNEIDLTCKGMKWQVNETGDLRFNSSLKLSAPDTDITAVTTFTLAAGVINLNSSTINFGGGSSPTTPIVLGPQTVEVLSTLIGALRGFIGAVQIDVALSTVSPAVVAAANVAGPLLDKLLSSGFTSMLSTQVKVSR